MTEEEFENAYAQRSGLTVEELRASGLTVLPCRCGDDICDGWQMLSGTLSEDPFIRMQAGLITYDEFMSMERAN